MIDVTSYGIVANNAGAATANSTALKNLVNPTVAGPKGTLVFPCPNGTDVYYFNDIIPVRDGIRMDLMGSKLNFSKSRTTSDNKLGFLTFIRDVSVENGEIVINYNGTGGVNAGMAMRIGGRDSYGFAGVADIFDASLPVPMGNVALRNLRITTNNPAVPAVLMLGGLRGVVVENVFIDGQGQTDTGIYYEFGAASTNGQAQTYLWSSSHATAMHFRNVVIKNLKANGTGGAGVSLIGAYACVVENLNVNTAFSAFEFRPGEALFYRPWLNIDDTGAKRGITLRNIVGENITNTGLQLKGAESAASGYLAPAGLTPAQQTELMHFSVDGFAIEAAGVGITVSGPCTIRNGFVRNAGSGIILTEDCIQFVIENVRLLNSTGLGIRASFQDPGTLWNPRRKKIGTIRNSQIAGATGAGISIDDSESVLIENNRLGFNAAYDGTTETTQTNGVVCGTTAAGVVCRGNFVSTSGGAVAYALIGAGVRGCVIDSPRGLATRSGSWGTAAVRDFTHSTNIGTASAEVNASGKFYGQLIWDTSNSVVRMALGPNPTDGWKGVDGSGTITPS